LILEKTLQFNESAHQHNERRGRAFDRLEQMARESVNELQDKIRDGEHWQKERIDLLDQIAKLRTELGLKDDSTRSLSTPTYNDLNRPEAVSNATPGSSEAHEGK
jgi:cell division septum initiation protein DivIVA